MVKQVAEERGLSEELCKFLMKMVKYEGRKSVGELLENPYLIGMEEGSSELGIFGTRKIKGENILLIDDCKFQ